jgi:DNA-binding CsgD family transcriptional regulator
MSQLRSPAQDQLSPRELDVLGWVAKGASNKEIGRKLHISEATVKSHLLHIYEKLGAEDRAHAVSLAVQKGLLDIA